jgi:hypothetical protein
LILAIDPGSEYSAYVWLDEYLHPYDFGKIPNAEMLDVILRSETTSTKPVYFVIEMVACYGMAVGKEIFETCVTIGRFIQFAEERGFFKKIDRIYRKEEKINLCGFMKAKDGNIRQALIDRFGPVGTKKNQGWFYGVSKDVWSAIAVGVTYSDMYLNRTEIEITEA